MIIKFIASVVFASILLCCRFAFAGEVEAMREPANKVETGESTATEKLDSTAGADTGKLDSTAGAEGTLSPSKTQSKKEDPSRSKQKSANMGINANEYKPYPDGTGELKVK